MSGQFQKRKHRTNIRKPPHTDFILFRFQIRICQRLRHICINIYDMMNTPVKIMVNKIRSSSYEL